MCALLTNMTQPFYVQPINTLSRMDTLKDDAALEDGVGAIHRQPGKGVYMTRALSPFRLRILMGVLCALLAVFVARSAWLQLLQGSQFLALAEGNRIQSDRLTAMRGKIFDRSGQLLVSNEPSFALWVNAAALEDSAHYVSLVAQAAALLDMEESGVHDLLLEPVRAGASVLLTPDLSHEQAMRVLAAPETYEAFEVRQGTRRTTTSADQQTLSGVIGYVGLINEEEYLAHETEGYALQDVIGKTGVEATYERLLRGRPGERNIETDAFGEALTVLNERQSIDGADLTLHVDIELQREIERLLNDRAHTQPRLRAAVVVLDPRDGAVRALVSYPGYALDTFGLRINRTAYATLVDDERQPLFPRAIAGQYPSGSTIKPVVAAAALEEGLINEHTSFLSTGGLRIGQFFFPDWKAGGHGVTDVRKALADSVNTYFYIIGGGYDEFQGLGLSRLVTYANRFGLGAPLGIDIGGEAAGFLPSDRWKRETKGEPWYIGDTYHVAIGQGDLLVTPLQVATMTAAFANGGTLFSPQVVDRYVEQGRVHDMTPVVLEQQVVSMEAIQIVREGLRQGVTYGSSRRLNDLPIKVAGKTGTAQWHSTRDPHAWFTGFAPYDDPQIVVTVLMEEGGEGSAVAVPLARDILSWWFAR